MFMRSAAAIVLSCTSRINVGVLAIGLAWLIGVYQAGYKPDAVIAGFPVTLFLMLAGVTLLFAGLFLLAMGWFATRYPMISPRLAADTLQREAH